MADLPPSDETVWRILFADTGLPPVQVRAAYATRDDKLDGWTVLKDHRHKIVALVRDPAGDRDDAAVVVYKVSAEVTP